MSRQDHSSPGAADDEDRAVIRRLAGDLPVRPLAPGLDHRVYAVGDALVARFGPDATREARLLAAIAPQLPLPVPVPVAAEAGCLLLPRVRGQALLDLPRSARGPFAAPLQAFADALHALAPDAAIDLDVDTPATWVTDARATWASLGPSVAPPLREAVEAFLGEPAPDPPARCRLIHGDLGAEHVFVEHGRITGIIDWGDAALGDPAIDHGRLLRDLGPTAATGGRARFYAVCTAIEDLAYGHPRYHTNALAALRELFTPQPPLPPVHAPSSRP